MNVSTWKGGTYGVRVGKENARTFFNKSWDLIEVKIGGEFFEFQLNSTFWTTCPEFRGNPLPHWFQAKGIDKWPKGSPHKLALRPITGNRFELSIPE